MRSKGVWARKRRVERKVEKAAREAKGAAAFLVSTDPGIEIEKDLQTADPKVIAEWFVWGQQNGSAVHRVEEALHSFRTGFARLYSVLRRWDIATFSVDHTGRGRLSPLWFHAASTPWTRPPEEWRPRGAKAKSSKAENLLLHLFAKYPVPRWLIPPDVMGGTVSLSFDVAFKLYVHIAGGGSVLGAVSAGWIPVPFTRRMAHEFTRVSGVRSPIEASRVAQALVHGLGSKSSRMTQEVLASWPGWGSPDYERFVDEVIGWLAKQAMVDPRQVRPMRDYLNARWHRRGFSMKGRTVTALVRQVEDWHRALAQEREVKGKIESGPFAPSGIPARAYLRHAEKDRAKEVWAFDEILTPKELSAEGAMMRHCVGSYARSIRSGRVSIWRLRSGFGDDVAMVGEWQPLLTVEVDNIAREITQARGRCNVVPNQRELAYLQRWAADSGLRIRAHL